MPNYEPYKDFNAEYVKLIQRLKEKYNEKAQSLVIIKVLIRFLSCRQFFTLNLDQPWFFGWSLKFFNLFLLFLDHFRPLSFDLGRIIVPIITSMNLVLLAFI